MESFDVKDILADAISTAVKQEKEIKMWKKVNAFLIGVIVALIVTVIYL